MKWLRALLAVAVVIAAAVSAWRLVIPRYRCNRDKAIVNATTILLESGPADYERTVKARRLAETCRRCLERFFEDYEFHLLLASNQWLMGDFEGAERSYRNSLALNERPETYANLALMQIEMGKTAEARKNLYHASLFHLAACELVTDPLRTEVRQAVLARHERLGMPRNSFELWRNRRRNLTRVRPP